MKKKKKKGLIIAAAAVVAVVVATVAFLPRNTAPVMANVSTEQLSKTTLRNTISATGTIQSRDSSSVYAKLAGTAIETVNVEVGDKVNAGDVLARFDTESIEDQIKQQKVSMNDSAARNQQSIKLSEKQYQQLLEDFQKNNDTALLSAEKNVETAQYALKDAQYAVDHFGEPTGGSDLKSDAELYGIALGDYEDANEDYESAKKALEDAKRAQAPKEQIEKLQSVYDATKSMLEGRREKYESAKIQYLDADHQYQKAVDALKQAQSSYDLAMEQYEITFNKSLQSIDSAADSIDTTKLNASQAIAQLTLATLEKQLEDAVVTAPVSGTVTAVYAKEGASASGLLFEIENTDELKVLTTVKEYDFPSIKLGLPVEIKSDGTGEAVMTGRISKIAPTAVKAAEAAAKSSSVEFAIEIDVEKPHDGLLIGMKARCSIILSEAADVYGVPYDAILTDADGSSYIFAAETNAEGQSVAKKIPVQLGMESDFYVEISGEGLTDGLFIITTPAGITEGTPVPTAQTPVV